MVGPRVAKVFPARPPFTLSSIPDLTGKTALVTGGTSGIGIETARILAHAGATVYITSRSVAKAQDAIRDIVDNGPDNWVSARKADVRAIQLDLDNIKTVATVAETVLRNISALDILVANAGHITREKKFTVDGIESQFAVSHVSHFVLVLTLLPAIEKAGSKTGDARIVIVSSHGQCDAPTATGIDLDSLTNTAAKDDGLSWRQRYGQAKLAGMLFMHSLSSRVSGNVRVNACHPGAVISHFNDGLFSDGNESWSLRFQLAIFKKFAMVPAATAALGTVAFLAAADKIREDDVRAGYFWPVATRKDEWASKWALDARLGDEMWEFTVRLVKKGLAKSDIELRPPSLKRGNGDNYPLLLT
ncbi:hypothetical protein V1525DRAFT_398068 [Lipomyces kononenkoae]|uniref:Uncharacterized protein n=1 Tax=Lipomyces kononenkoae TaxID=34357 RepID=A0ACC3T969_LIPKO